MIIQSETEGEREMRVISWREILPAAAPSNAHCDALCRCQLSEQHNKLCMFVALIEHLAKLKCILLRSLRWEKCKTSQKRAPNQPKRPRTEELTVTESPSWSRSRSCLRLPAWLRHATVFCSFLFSFSFIFSSLFFLLFWLRIVAAFLCEIWHRFAAIWDGTKSQVVAWNCGAPKLVYCTKGEGGEGWVRGEAHS